ncbi:site-specific recombinase [Bacillus cereus B4264]|uniref:Site-specific recombinase n=1 Tax=Bacillus cereus (strain B4264) TaxID=405532 RepID=B7H7H1_BACC4|nr:site-specific recombinase [Bacillus cereus B4264]
MKYGYARVSTVIQELELLLQVLGNKVCNVIFSAKSIGTKADRPNLMCGLE